MSTASTESGNGYNAALDAAAGDRIQVGDLLDDPRTDAEALCLCSLLWSAAPTARAITIALRSGDFHRSVYGELFDIIAEQVAVDTPHDPASIAAALTQAGKTADTAEPSSPGPSPRPPWPAAHPKPPGTTPSPWPAPPTGAASTPPPRRWPRPPNNYLKTNCSTTW